VGAAQEGGLDRPRASASPRKYIRSVGPAPSAFGDGEKLFGRRRETRVGLFLSPAPFRPPPETTARGVGRNASGGQRARPLASREDFRRLRCQNWGSGLPSWPCAAAAMGSTGGTGQRPSRRGVPHEIDDMATFLGPGNSPAAMVLRHRGQKKRPPKSGAVRNRLTRLPPIIRRGRRRRGVIRRRGRRIIDRRRRRRRRRSQRPTDKPTQDRRTENSSRAASRSRSRPGSRSPRLGTCQTGRQQEAAQAECDDFLLHLAHLEPNLRTSGCGPSPEGTFPSL